jgi:hypothetical protein
MSCWWRVCAGATHRALASYTRARTPRLLRVGGPRQVLLAGGYRRDHIVVMAADDLAHDPENPMPGRIFNMPGGAPSARVCVGGGGGGGVANAAGERRI